MSLAVAPTVQPRLAILPCSLNAANAFVALYHRHHRPLATAKFSIAVCDDTGTVRGVAIVARPAVPQADDGWTAEVARLATDGCANACSALYGAAWRAARGMGYRRLQTYILADEPGTSLRAAGWHCVAERTGGGTWHQPLLGRYRLDKHPLGPKQRWEIGTPPPYPERPVFPRSTGALPLRLVLGLPA